MSNSTQVEWIPASEPPADVPPGAAWPVIVARRSATGRWFVFGGVYLNQVQVDEDVESEETLTGFHVDYKHEYYDVYYESIDVEFWAPMPEPPTGISP